MSDHPSFLELDRAFVEQRELSHCEECQVHLGRLSQPVAVPQWARELPQPKTRRRFWQWLTPLVLVLGSALLYVSTRQPEVLSKGSTPSVAVYVKRGEAVSLWNGVSPLLPGDAVQLKVQPAGFAHVTIGALEDDSMHELFQSQLDGSPTLLPESFTLDSSPGNESLLIVFSQKRVAESELTGAWHELPRNKKVWSTVLVLRKSGGTP